MLSWKYATASVVWLGLTSIVWSLAYAEFQCVKRALNKWVEISGYPLSFCKLINVPQNL